MRKILFLSVLTVVAASAAGCGSCRLPSCEMPWRNRPQYCCPQPQYQCAPACAPVAQCCDPCGGGAAAVSAPMMMSEPAAGSCCQ